MRLADRRSLSYKRSSYEGNSHLSDNNPRALGLLANEKLIEACKVRVHSFAACPLSATDG